jgi:integrase
VYNDALAVDETLPANPCVALRKRWFREYRRQEPVADLRGWWLDVQKMENPIRRCFQMVVLTTGLRSEDARTIRWEHIDFERATLTRPRPKGGEDRAFTVPLSNFTMGLLRHLRRQIEILYPKAPWVFPSVGRDRQIIHMKSPREWRLGLPSPHRLRDTYTSACHEAGLSPYDIDVLTNHRPPTGNVTAGYIRQSDDHLRHCQEKVTARLLGSVMKERHDVSGRG